MSKNKRSEQLSTGRQKRAKAQPENPLPSPSSPSRIGYQQIQPDPPLPVEEVTTEGFATTESVARIDRDRRTTNPKPESLSPELLSNMAQEMQSMHNIHYDHPSILHVIHFNLLKVLEKNPTARSLIPIEVFLSNASRKQASGFLDLVKKAAREKDWKDVILHDALWTEFRPDPSPRFLSPPESPDMLVPKKSSQRAAELAWNVDFVGQAVLTALEDHVSQQMDRVHTYPFCPIVQSSGMGKSRLLDEFSKNHFLIPINLRPGNSGYPPADVAVRVFLTRYDSYDREIQQKSYSRACHFLFSLFVHTKDLIVTLGANNKEDRIVKFREFMSKGQTFVCAGESRRNFYADIVKRAQKNIDDQVETPSYKRLRGAFKKLQESVCEGTSLKGKRSMADVFIGFDEAHSLMDQDQTSGLSNYTELQRALQALSTSSLFSLFLSTTGKISQFSPPPTTHNPSNIDFGTFTSKFEPPRPFIELGFDQLMRNREVLDKYKTLEQVTSSECIAHMGRPLWGTMYDLGDVRVRNWLLLFAVEKLLNGPITSTLTQDLDQQYAVLSQRLALDINTTAYVSAPPIDAPEKILKQIENHMRVCVGIGDGVETICGIAASEPILSEAASYIMRQDFPNLDLAEALSNVLSGFSIDLGDRGELLVAAFFTWARDNAIVERPSPLPEFCRHFSVEELFSCLFFEPIAQPMFDDTPSIGPSKAEKRTLGEVTCAAYMHFNHFINAQEKKFVAHHYLIAVMARGAALLGAKCRADVDMVFPYLYGSTDLDDKNVGFIMVQVENDNQISVPDADLFRKMDPFHCGLLDKSDRNVSCSPFSIPIIRIVFALRGNEPKVTHMKYSSPSEGALPAGLDDRGEPCFTSYDYWCSGIGPNLLQPVRTAYKWKELLDKTDPGPWASFYNRSLVPDVLRSQFPASSCHESHMNNWLSDSWISEHS